MINYRIYPSLLDSYSWYEKNESSTALQEFLDRVNRAPQPYSEAADKGTKFNRITDALLKNSLPDGVYLSSDAKSYIYPADNVAPEFYYPVHICHEFARELKGSASQVFVRGTIETKYGLVELYGYADNVLMDTVIDQKTLVKAYEFPKFLHNWQHIVYPYCLRQQGVKVERFAYLITDFTSTYNEDYEYNEEKDLPRLKVQLEKLIEFLENVRPLVTDLKIFNQLPVELLQCLT
jgi:hypothetical protein